MLLIVVASEPVPIAPNTAVSEEPGFPLLGFQLAFTFQLFGPGVGTFQRKTVALEVWHALIAAAKTASPARIRRGRGVIERRFYQSLLLANNRIFVLEHFPSENRRKKSIAQPFCSRKTECVNGLNPARRAWRRTCLCRIRRRRGFWLFRPRARSIRAGALSRIETDGRAAIGRIFSARHNG
jgi:hypothetical protein